MDSSMNMPNTQEKLIRIGAIVICLIAAIAVILHMSFTRQYQAATIISKGSRHRRRRRRTLPLSQSVTILSSTKKKRNITRK